MATEWKAYILYALFERCDCHFQVKKRERLVVDQTIMPFGRSLLQRESLSLPRPLVVVLGKEKPAS